MYNEEKKELTEICRLLYERKLVTACDGNVSKQVSKDYIIITPSGKNKGFLKPEEILVVDNDGNIAEGNGKASKEFPLHSIVYEKIKYVSAVIHTHPIYATAFAVAGKNIPSNYLIESIMLGKCGLAPYAQPGSKQLAENVAPFLESCNAVLLQNHGALTYGIDLMDAYNKMEILESIAKTIIMSHVIGKPIEIPE